LCAALTFKHNGGASRVCINDGDSSSANADLPQSQCTPDAAYSLKICVLDTREGSRSGLVLEMSAAYHDTLIHSGKEDNPGEDICG
jgi:hypothetical protein